jgi:hypothetical protein
MIRRSPLATAAAAVLLAVASSAAFAQASMPRVDTRQAHQEARIDQGVAAGTLTPHEANRLERGDTKIDRMENRALSDGTVTRKERVRLHQAQDVQSHRIFAQKHDRQNDFNHNGRADRPGVRR